MMELSTINTAFLIAILPTATLLAQAAYQAAFRYWSHKCPKPPMIMEHNRYLYWIARPRLKVGGKSVLVCVYRRAVLCPQHNQFVKSTNHEITCVQCNTGKIIIPDGYPPRDGSKKKTAPDAKDLIKRLESSGKYKLTRFIIKVRNLFIPFGGLNPPHIFLEDSFEDE